MCIPSGDSQNPRPLLSYGHMLEALVQIIATPNINVLTQTEVTALDGDEVLREITLRQRTPGARPHRQYGQDARLRVRHGAGAALRDCQSVQCGSLVSGMAGVMIGHTL
jgi:hypothetical protein